MNAKTNKVDFIYQTGNVITLPDSYFKDITEEKKKNIDLTFVRFAQRKRTALDYIESVSCRNKAKEMKRNKRNALIMNIVFYSAAICSMLYLVTRMFN